MVYKRDAALINPLEHFSFSEEPVRVELNEDESAEFCDVELSLSKSIDEVPAFAIKGPRLFCICYFKLLYFTNF